MIQHDHTSEQYIYYIVYYENIQPHIGMFSELAAIHSLRVLGARFRQNEKGISDCGFLSAEENRRFLYRL